MTGLPFADVTVISVEQAVAAPFASRQLADLGARVVKIERFPSGDFARGYDEAVLGQASYFVWLNRSKESVYLDLKSPSGRGALRRLIDRADVVLENLAPGAMTRLGFDMKALRQDRPGLICCSISGYGQTGAASQRKAYDLLIQCESGLVSLTGGAGKATRIGISIADIAAGMYAFSGVAAALYRRAVTGNGTYLDVSMLECVMEWMAQPAYMARYRGAPPAVTGVAHPTIAPYGAFTTADGTIVVIAVQNEREWRSLCTEVLGRPDLVADERYATNSDRVHHREEVDGIVDARLREISGVDAEQRLRAAGIATGRLNDIGEAMEHPALAERGRWSEIDTPAGRVGALLPPAVPEGCSPRMDPVPAAGEHTVKVLCELGYTPVEIEELTGSRAVPMAAGSAAPQG